MVDAMKSERVLSVAVLDGGQLPIGRISRPHPPTLLAVPDGGAERAFGMSAG
jgi:hypothetical protein